MVAVSGLVLVHIIPHSLASAGLWAVLVAAIGLLGPGFLEHRLHRAAQTTHTTTMIIALGGLMVHAFFDGAALNFASYGHEHDHTVSIAVALHRVPIAITVWWLAYPSWGRNAAIAILVGLGAATIGGFVLADLGELASSSPWLGLLQSFIAGSLLHVVVHRPAPLSTPSVSAGGRLYAGLGALAGVAIVWALADTHLPLQPEPGTANVGQTFVALALETAPALVLSFALAGLVQVFLPRASLHWMRTGRPLTESLRGVAFGLPLPICSCGVIPLYKSLQHQAVPATASMSFLVATPELGLDAVLVSLPLLGSSMTIARVLCAALVAVLAGWLVGQLVRPSTPSPKNSSHSFEHAQPSFVARVRAGLHFGFGEIVDHIGPWLLVGLAVASLAEPLLQDQWLTQLPWGTDVILFSILGIPTYVCASGATPLAAILIHKGVSPGAALAFLLAGPATNITTFGVLAKIHNKNIALLYGAVIAGSAICLGFVVNIFLSSTTGFSPQSAAHESTSVYQIISLVVVGIVFSLSILRQGPRSFVGQVLAPYSEHSHEDDTCSH